LPAFHPPKPSALHDKLTRYLALDPEDVTDALQWWHEHRTMYPHLLHMALDYLSIPGKFKLQTLYSLLLTCSPATSVDVERLFSRGRLLLSHVRSQMSPQSTRAVLCLGAWSRLGFVKEKDILAVAQLPDLQDGGSDYEMETGFDSISVPDN
jgi:hypothetical protein